MARSPYAPSSASGRANQTGRKPHVNDIADHAKLPHVRFRGGPLAGCLVGVTREQHAAGRWECRDGNGSYVAGMRAADRIETWDWEDGAP